MMKSTTLRNMAIGVFVSGVFFIALGAVLLAAGGGPVNFVTIGAGALQFVNGFSLLGTASRVERFDV